MRPRRKKTHIKSTSDRLRLSVFRSRSNIYAQIIDDKKGETLVSANSLKLSNGNTKDAATKVGQMLAEAAGKKKINDVVFDRGRYVYKGRVKELADSARKAGLNF